MPNTVLNSLEDVKDEVDTRLGASRIEVELDDKDVTSCLKHALREYSRHVPGRAWAALAATPSQKQYRADQAMAGFLGVLNVGFINRRVDPAAFDPFDPYDTIVSGLLIGGETFGDIDQRLIYLEDVRRIVSAEPEWKGQWERVDVGGGTYESQYMLYVDITREETLVCYEFTHSYDINPAAQNGMTAIPSGDVDWILGWTTARAKRIVAKIRGKFGGIPNSDGGEDNIDAQQLQSEAEAEERELTDEILRRRPPLAPVIE